MLDGIYDKITELTVSGLKRKQKSITRLFPPFYQRVDQVKAKGGIRLVNTDSKKHLWTFKVHSGTQDGLWYTDYVQFKNLPDMIAKHVQDRRLWTKDKKRVDYNKLAKKILAKVDIAVSCSCPAAKFWGPDYILSLDKYKAKYGEQEDRPPKIRNPKQYGALCKHAHAVMMVALPFYSSTLAKFLKENYGDIVSKYEKSAQDEADKFKAAADALKKKKEEIDTKGAEDIMKRNSEDKKDEDDKKKNDKSDKESKPEDIEDEDKKEKTKEARNLNMSKDNANYTVWWHGSPSGKLVGSYRGIHLGTYEAAKVALCAVIGIPVNGMWDGTRKYGETLLAGKNTMRLRNDNITGINCGAPIDDYYIAESDELPIYSSKEPISFDELPSILPYKIIGKMSNTPQTAHQDYKANGYMAAQLKRNRAVSGYYYKNESEDYGSISVVVPDASFIARISLQENAKESKTSVRDTHPHYAKDDYEAPSIESPLSTEKWYHGGIERIEDLGRNIPTFFTRSFNGAEWYAINRTPENKGIVYSCRLNIKNPARVRELVLTADKLNITDKDLTKYYATHEDYNDTDFLYVPEIINELKKNGFDGYVGSDVLSNDEIDIAVPFYKKQVKLIGVERVSIDERLDFKDTTDIPFYDGMLKNPEYYKDAKGIEFEIIEMSPSDYIDIGVNAMWARSYSMRRDYDNDIEKFKRVIFRTRLGDIKKYSKDFWKDASLVDMPVFEFGKDNAFSQEGFHRAIKAKHEGISKMPVMCVFNNVKKSDIIRKFPKLKKYISISNLSTSDMTEAKEMENEDLKQEKIDWFNERTNEHIKRVQKAAEKIVAAYPKYLPLISIVQKHDASKFEEPELTPYIELTWNKKHGTKSDPETQDAIIKATLHHIKTNSHHPEYHLKDKDKANISADNRDRSDQCVDATLMDSLSIAEMVADWVAMSEELQTNTPRQWYNNTKDVRWHFSNRQDKLIDRLLKVFE